jgi:hypothetical protein
MEHYGARVKVVSENEDGANGEGLTIMPLRHRRQE